MQLRQHFRVLRKKKSLEERVCAAAAAAAKLCSQSFFQQSKQIACYLPQQDEFDTQPLITAILQAKKQCYLPVLLEKGEKSLCFAPYKDGDVLCLNRYAILEPIDKTHLLPAEELDVVILPLLAFDAEGHRLGMGGGYYDCTFGFKQQRIIKKPYLVGLAYAAQEAEQLPTDQWDVGLDIIVTEKAVKVFR